MYTGVPVVERESEECGETGNGAVAALFPKSFLPRLPGIQACSVWLLSLWKSKTAEAETPKKHGNARVPHPHLSPVLTYLGPSALRQHTCVRAQQAGIQKY